MKELTYEDWQKNPTPREMLCWNSNVEHKIQAKVLFVVKTTRGCRYPVLTVMKDDVGYDTFQHCAEIPKTRRMTNKELSRWLRENPTREYKYKNCDDYIFGYHEYKECSADEEVDDHILIRESDSEWREPLVEIEE